MSTIIPSDSWRQVLEAIPKPNVSKTALQLAATSVGVFAASFFHAFPLAIGLSAVVSQGIPLAGFACLQYLTPLDKNAQKVAFAVMLTCTSLSTSLLCFALGLFKHGAVILLYNAPVKLAWNYFTSQSNQPSRSRPEEW